jgi:hypothetical protein
MPEAIQNLLYSIGQPHSVPMQISVAIVVTIGLLLCIASAVFSRTPESQDELEHWGDIPALPGLNTRGASIETGCDCHRRFSRSVLGEEDL